MNVAKEVALFKLKCGHPKEATKDFERLVKLNSSDTSAVVGLINCYAQYDPTLGEKLENNLKMDEMTKSSFNIPDLEAKAIGRGKEYRKRNMDAR